MTKIGVITCDNIRDKHCMGCIKCFKAAANKEGHFSEHEDDIEVVFWTGCGGCPGLYMPKFALIHEMTEKLGREYDVIHIGTCVVKAAKTSGCPIELETMKKNLETKWGKKVIIGTHTY